MSTTPFMLIPTGPSDPQQPMGFISGNDDIRNFQCISQHPTSGLLFRGPCLATVPSIQGAIVELNVSQTWTVTQEFSGLPGEVTVATQPRSLAFPSGMMVGALAMLLLVVASSWWRRSM